MKENKYDKEVFFEKYSNLERSKKGLEGAGEWESLKKMLPSFKNKKVLDLGCGFGWHCRYAVENGAHSVIGIDISQNMINKAVEMTSCDKIKYICMPVEDINYPADSFDVIISSLTLHYIKSFDAICQKIASCLVKDGIFVFSVEHPVFTANGLQDWYYDTNGNKLHWPVDRYFEECKRKAVFLGEPVEKYHKTLTSYLGTLIKKGFEITDINEPVPSLEMLKNISEMKDELRRPMMLLVSSAKK